MDRPIRVACVQSDVAFGEPMANARAAVARLEWLRDQQVDLAVFPEAFLTGYCVDSRDAARSIAIPRDHEALRLLRLACDRLGMHAVVGFADAEGASLYNAAAFFEPNEPTRLYRKTHLPFLGYDNYVRPGDSLPVLDTRLGKIGILVCFDLRPPEPSRVLALKGAELIVLPTNWPEGADFAPDHMAACRAAENKVFFATCNRVGAEGGFRFIGKSGIYGLGGQTLARAGDGEEVIQADIDLNLARNKRNVTIPGKYETTVFESRRPELYREIEREP